MSRADKVMYIAKKQKNSIVTEWDRDRHPTDWKKHYSDGTKQKILIVDDSEMNRAILYEMLHDDFEILEARKRGAVYRYDETVWQRYFSVAAGYCHAGNGRLCGVRADETTKNGSKIHRLL